MRYELQIKFPGEIKTWNIPCKTQKRAKDLTKELVDDSVQWVHMHDSVKKTNTTLYAKPLPFADWFEVLDFFGGQIPQDIEKAKKVVAKHNRLWDSKLYNQALQNSENP